MAKKLSKAESLRIYQDEFLAGLNRKLATPTKDYPTVRIWRKSVLLNVFRHVREELAAKGLKSDLSLSALLEWLCHLGLAAQIPVEQDAIFLIEMGANEGSDVDPFELMMANKPAGVICYFSAVVFHSLTTQMPEHHHIAELEFPSPKRDRDVFNETSPDIAEKTRVSQSRKPRGLGTLLFQFHGISFYSTRRKARLVPGVQTRRYGPRAQLRITTLEQTLLDTLYKPFHCGGPEVVFEAWHEGVTSRRIDEERLVLYLQKMNYPATARRLGMMLKLVGGTPGGELRSYLNTCQEAIDPQGPHSQISLLPGLNYSNLDHFWLVNTP